MYDDARAAATSYELQRLAGPLPEVVVAPVADMAASINDGPTEDLDIEDQVYSAERIRSQSAGEPAPDPTVSGDLAGTDWRFSRWSRCAAPTRSPWPRASSPPAIRCRWVRSRGG